ncbi:MAG: GNAT family N-acetyltransferase [Ruminiclostridium sp.]
MKKSDYPAVRRIHQQGIDGGKATFRRKTADCEEFDKGHLPFCRYVAEEEGKILGWITLCPTRGMYAYHGAVEISIYVDSGAQGKGIGTALMEKVIEEAPKHGVWTLESWIFAINRESLALHRKMGFRTVGTRERIGRGADGEWLDVVIMELRLPDELIADFDRLI